MVAETKPAAGSGVAGEMEVEAYRRLFPVAFLERHLSESVRIDSRRLREARPTTVALGAVSSVHGSALARLGDTVILPRSSPLSPMLPVLLVSRS
jgi:exosome complex component RRP43